ncbi:MAG: hypothetical protein H6811_08305 [Phycisphaeraceae bacterium]|nr:hypothetical protein [Phycisphaeraceae bacterium]
MPMLRLVYGDTSNDRDTIPFPRARFARTEHPRLVGADDAIEQAQSALDASQRHLDELRNLAQFPAQGDDGPRAA